MLGWDLHGHPRQLTADQAAQVRDLLAWSRGGNAGVVLPPLFGESARAMVLVTAARYARARHAAPREPPGREEMPG